MPIHHEHVIPRSSVLPSRRRGDALDYMAQLDGLRAVAVTAVMISHFDLFREVAPLARISFGTIGVDLFFVLSGFLITSILLKGRRRIERGGQVLGLTLRQFYVRRFLRIFPAYYLTVLVLTGIGIESVRDHLPWHLTYTTNVRMAAMGHSLGSAGHFWSLAVEEQFYLFWPWLILLIPRRWLVPTVACVVGVSVSARPVLWLLGANDLAIKVLTVCCLDFLGTGALLAIANEAGAQNPGLRRALLRAGLWIGVPLTLLAIGAGLYAPDLFTVFSGLPLALGFVWLIERASQGRADLLGRCLCMWPLVAVGRISYGIYLFHRFVQRAVESLASRWELPLAESPYIAFPILVAATVATAALSWLAFERPINGLKRYFPYTKIVGRSDGAGASAKPPGGTYDRSQGSNGGTGTSS